MNILGEIVLYYTSAIACVLVFHALYNLGIAATLAVRDWSKKFEVNDD